MFFFPTEWHLQSGRRPSWTPDALQHRHGAHQNHRASAQPTSSGSNSRALRPSPVQSHRPTTRRPTHNRPDPWIPSTNRSNRSCHSCWIASANGKTERWAPEAPRRTSSHTNRLSAAANAARLEGGGDSVEKLGDFAAAETYCSECHWNADEGCGNSKVEGEIKAED